MEEGVLARIAQEEEVWFQHGGKWIEREEEWTHFKLGRKFGQKSQGLYIQGTRRLGNAITTRVAMAGALDIVKKKDKNLLAENGGHIVINKSWAQYLLQGMNYRCKKEGMQQS